MEYHSIHGEDYNKRKKSQTFKKKKGNRSLPPLTHTFTGDRGKKRVVASAAMALDDRVIERE
jgi:hypothetical protein